MKKRIILVTLLAIGLPVAGAQDRPPLPASLQPVSAEEWTQQHARHLLFLSGFSGDQAEVQRVHALGAAGAVDELNRHGKELVVEPGQVMKPAWSHCYVIIWSASATLPNNTWSRPVRAHDDEVHLARLRGVDDLLKGDTVQGDTISRQPGRRHTSQRGFHAALLFRFHLLQIGLRQRHTHVDRGHERRHSAEGGRGVRDPLDEPHGGRHVRRRGARRAVPAPRA